jgi:hypothetical protein
MPHPERHSPDSGLRRRFRRAKRRGAVWTRARARTVLGAATAVVSLLLLVAHGVNDLGFVVDTTSLGLLGFASLPFLSLVLTTFKAGGVEFSFRELPVHAQVLTFLDGIAMKGQWTFFKPRHGEQHFGAAFADLTGELVKNARTDLVQQLRNWLASEEANQRWFAAEIIGYHQIAELHRAVRTAPSSDPVNDSCEPWELNCIWAASRLEAPMYERLRQLLLKTVATSNQVWILNAFDQMIESGQAKPDEFNDVLAEFLSRLQTAGISDLESSAVVGGLTHLKFLQTAGGLRKAG